jgi:hypothetical protein
MVGYLGISLSSGATRGLYTLGALHAAECNGLLTHVKYYGGCSIGSIIAMLLAIGYKPIELFTVLCTNDISNTVEFGTIDLTEVLKNWGMLSTQPLRSYLSQHIISKYGGIPTFEELYKTTGNVLVCPAYRLKSSEPRVYFSHLTYPKMSVLDAVMLSSNIPFVFQAMSYEDYYYIDGGTFDLNPIAKVEEMIRADFGRLDVLPDYKILSITLDIRTTHEADGKMKNVYDYIKEIAFLSMYCQQQIASTPTVDNVYLDTGSNAKSLALLKLDNKLKMKWFCSGLEQGLAYFKG